MRLKYFLTFLALGAVCLVYAVTMETLWLRAALVSCAVAFGGVGLAYGFLGPGALLKRSSGQLSPLSYLLFWPYHLLNHLLLFAFRRTGRGNTLDRVDEGLYLGCKLNASDRAMLERLGIRSILDVCCEFGEPVALRRGRMYRSIPLLDTTAPTAEQLQEGAAWIKQQTEQGPVYVHCALGHGRSATLAAAYLLLSGKAPTVEQAIAQVTTARPGVKLHPAQRACLRELEAAKQRK